MNSIHKIQQQIGNLSESDKNYKSKKILLYCKLGHSHFIKKNRIKALEAFDKVRLVSKEIVEDLQSNFSSLEEVELTKAIHTSIVYAQYIDTEYVSHASNALLNNHHQHITPFIEADLYLIKGKIYNRQRDFKKAISLIEKAIHLFSEINNNIYIISALEELSLSNYMQENYLDAVGIQKRILSIIPTENIDKRVANYNLMGLYYQRLNNFNAALEQFTLSHEMIKHNPKLFSPEMFKKSQINIDNIFSKINENK